MHFEEDTKYQETSNKIKNVGKVLMLLITLGGLSGVFGYGVWTKKKLGDPNLFYVEFERFLHVSTETPIEVGLNSKLDSVRVYISKEYFDKVKFRHISPEPEKIVLNHSHYVFTFPKKLPGLEKIIFISKADKAGSVKADISYAGQTFYINQFIYP